MSYKHQCLLIYFIYFSTSQIAFAFNYDECRRGLISEPPNPYWGISSSSTVLTNATILPTEITKFSSQFSSSYGECRAIDFRTRDKLDFIEANLEQIKIDTARGNGEYLHALLVLYDCKEQNEIIAMKLLQKKFEYIYVTRSCIGLSKECDSSTSQVYSKINYTLADDLELKAKCKI